MNIRVRNFVTLFMIAVFIFALGLLSGCKGKKEEGGKMAGLQKLPDIKERLAKYSPTEITFDQSLLNDEQKRVLEKFVRAAKHMDNIFWRQAYHEGGS